MDLSTQRVLITGAATGIGAATARALAARGARIGLVGLEPDRLARLAAELGGTGHAWAEADITDSAGLQVAVDTVADTLGGLDTVIANAGIASFGTVRSYEPEAFARTVEVNLTGTFRTAHATLPRLVASRGYLLVVSSLASTVPAMGFSAYGASKAGVEALADALRIEAAPLGVAVGCAHMCWIDTEMVREAERDLSTFRAMREQLVWPLNTVRPVSECAGAFVRAVQRRSRRVNVPGVVGLFHWIRPLVHTGLVDSLLARRTAGQLAALDDEIRTLGRSVSERVRRSQPMTTHRRS